MFSEQKLAYQNGVSATVSIKDWLLLDCLSLLNLIPILGSIVYLVLILMIGLGSTSARSMRNRVIASLIWMIVWTVIGVIIAIFFGGALAAFVSSASNYY